jgi:hypothetical protein
MPLKPLSRRAALSAAATFAALATLRPAFAQEGASLAARKPVVAPLQPVEVDVRIPGYTGPAAIVLFDDRKRFAGVAEGRVENGVGTLIAIPRGALGAQWAALFASGQFVAANPALFTLDARTEIWTGQERFDRFVPNAAAIFTAATLSYTIGNVAFRGYRSPDSPLIWLRDHVYAQRGARYFDADLKTAFDDFRRYQQPDGSFPDFLPRPPWTDRALRVPVEADVEYLYVQGVYEAWQATGDDGWMRGHLEPMRRAVTYSLQHPLRWDAERGLIRRPFTIDTWDFEYGPTTIDPDTGKPAPRHWIDDRTIWGVFHGDNTGMAQALTMLARMEERVGDTNLARVWRDVAAGLMRNLNALSWNGRFFRHHVPAQPFDIPGVDRERQLSLSNAYALNRGVLTVQQGQAIIDEYIERSKTMRAFAEWFSIDPPFPPGSFGLAGRSGELPGAYVNGGIMPITGGELARGAFRYGNETYGFAILEHYWLRMLSRGRTFLWYHPDGAEGVGSEDTIPTDAWGTAAMFTALIEGAAGIEDRGVAMRDVIVSPRWGATGLTQAYVSARYPAGDGYLAYVWRQNPRSIDIDLSGAFDRAQVRVLLPLDAPGDVEALVNGAPVASSSETLRASRYVIIDVADMAVVQVQVRW